jgi:heme/copper-type cytochrome/quinol oxidase subunit 4
MSKPIRILTAILASLAIGGMFAYQDAQKNEPTYQQHPVTVILTNFFCASLVGLIFYFGSGWLEGRKGQKAKQSGDDKFYDEVACELQEKPLAPGLWTKAFAETGGDDAKTRALYIRYRIQQLRDERVEIAYLQAKEARAAAEAAKPSHSATDRIAYAILAVIFALLTLVCFFVLAQTIIDLTKGEATFLETIMGDLVIGVIGYGCGWITFKGAKAAMR